MIMHIDGTPEEVRPVLNRAARSGRPATVVPLADGRVRVTVGRASGQASRGTRPRRPAAAPTGTAEVDRYAARQLLPAWAPWALVGAGVTLATVGVVLAVMWVRAHLAMTIVIACLAALATGKVLAWRARRRGTR